MGRSKFDNPESLRDVRVEFQQMLETIISDIDKQYLEGYVVWDDATVKKIQDKILKQDTNTLSDAWYEQFRGGCYYSGILSLEPWCTCPGSDYEEGLWETILHKHAEFKKGKLVFKYNPESPINDWLRKHTSDGDTPINVETILEHAVKIVLEDWEFDIEPFPDDTELEDEE